MAKKQFVPLKIALLKARMIKLREDCSHRMHMVDFVHVIDSALYVIAQYRRENKTLIKKINNSTLPMIDLKSIPLTLSKENPSLMKILELQQETVDRIKGEGGDRIELLEDQVNSLTDDLYKTRKELEELENTKAEELSSKHIALIQKFNEVNKAAGIMMEQNRLFKTERMLKDELIKRLKKWIRFAYHEIEPGEKTVATVPAIEKFIKFSDKKKKLPKLFISIVDMRSEHDEFLQSMTVGVQNAIIDMAYSLYEKFPGKIKENHFNHIPSRALKWLTKTDWFDLVKDAGTMQYIARLYEYFGIEFKVHHSDKKAVDTLRTEEGIHIVPATFEEIHMNYEGSYRMSKIIVDMMCRIKEKHPNRMFGKDDVPGLALGWLSEKDWIVMRNCGRVTMNEIREMYKYYGIKFYTKDGIRKL